MNRNRQGKKNKKASQPDIEIMYFKVAALSEDSS